jgi:hypothetical protein
VHDNYGDSCVHDASWTHIGAYRLDLRDGDHVVMLAVEWGAGDTMFALFRAAFGRYDGGRKVVSHQWLYDKVTLVPLDISDFVLMDKALVICYNTSTVSQRPSAAGSQVSTIAPMDQYWT